MPPARNWQVNRLMSPWENQPVVAPEPSGSPRQYERPRSPYPLLVALEGNPPGYPWEGLLPASDWLKELPEQQETETPEPLEHQASPFHWDTPCSPGAPDTASHLA